MAGLEQIGWSNAGVANRQRPIKPKASPSVLAVYLEPAPYVVALVENLRSVWGGRVYVAYAALDLSQRWDHRLGEDEQVLPRRITSALGQLRRALASGRYGLLHLAGWGHPVLLGALLLAKWYGIPVAMESDTPRPPQGARWKAALKRLLYPKLFTLPAVFLPGGSRQALYLRDYGIGEERIHVARMTVDVARIQNYLTGRESELRHRFRAENGIPIDAVSLLFLGRLEPHKGVLDLLEAFSMLRESGVTLAVVGDGSLRGAVEGAAAANDKIRYLGRLSGNSVWEAYCASDLLVLPSRFEPWGLVVNEAMAAGIPVIVTDRVGCVDDLVDDGTTGLIVPAESPKLLCQAILRLVRERDMRVRLGQQARALISGWTLHTQAERTVAAWSSVCEVKPCAA